MLRVAGLAVALVALAAMPLRAAEPSPSPYRDLSRSGADFPGPGRDVLPPPGLTSVRIGLLGPGRRPAGDRLREGAMLALQEANDAGGLNGLPYEAVFRADDGRWGVGAQQVTALAYEDSVWVVIGGLEGGDAHLAELVAAKLWVPVVTPTASDFTIDYANVPWVFRYAPSDTKQARDLLELAARRRAERVLAYCEDDREGRTGARRLEAAARPLPLTLVGPRTFRGHLAADAVVAEDLAAADAIVIWARSAPGRSILSAVRGAGFTGTVLAPAGFLSSGTEEWPDNAGDVVVAAPCGLDPAADPVLRAFAARYADAYGRPPDAVAVLAYDTTRLVTRAIERGGLNRARIRDALAVTDFVGLAGVTRFDELGGSDREPVLVTWRSGRWTPLAEGPRETDRRGYGRSPSGGATSSEP